jgi:hypothetical protein
VRTAHPRHISVTEEVVEQAALYSLGMLPDWEARGYERHLHDCSVCTREVREAYEVVACISMLTPSRDPPPRLKERLLQSLVRVDDS